MTDSKQIRKIARKHEDAARRHEIAADAIARATPGNPKEAPRQAEAQRHADKMHAQATRHTATPRDLAAHRRAAEIHREIAAEAWADVAKETEAA